MKLKLTQKKKTKIIAITILVVGVLVAILVISFIIDVVYADKFYPGVKIAKVNISRLDKEQAERIFQAKIQELNTNGQKFYYQSKHVALYPTTFAANDPDLVYEIISFNLEQNLDQAYQLGRGTNFFDNIWQKIKLIFINKNIKIDYSLDSEEVEKILKDNFSDLEKPGQNPSIEYIQNKITITSGKLGLTFNYQDMLEKLESNLSNLNFKHLELNLALDYPKFNNTQAEFLITEIQQIIDLSPVQIYATTTSYYDRLAKKDWTISQVKTKEMLELDWNETDKQPELIFEPKITTEFLSSINQEISQPVKEAKFEIIDNRVTEFQASQVGQEIDMSATIESLENNIIKNKNKQAKIIITQTEPQAATENINDLGIKNLIGIGTSNFSGSPRNRRHNIKVGAESLNGLLLPVDEEFSINKALGSINAAKGYLPELVIKGTRTIPEYGGGLCQIATTAFRLAINSGLPITERRTHAYRVSYYEPAGTDATIYSPHPDVRFINDTPSHLLLQTRIEGDSVIFEFWGTHDNRQVATTTPIVFNITTPGPTKYVETIELEPEEINCIETAHNGASAEFTRTITYNDGEVKEELWESSYRPWQAVCLVGIDPDKVEIDSE